MPQDLDHGRSTETVPSNSYLIDVETMFPQIPSDALETSRGATDKARATQVLAGYLVAMAGPDELEDATGFF